MFAAMFTMKKPKERFSKTSPTTGSARSAAKAKMLLNWTAEFFAVPSFF